MKAKVNLINMKEKQEFHYSQKTYVFCIKIHEMFNSNFYSLQIMVKMMWIYVKKCEINSILKKLVCKIKKIKVGTFMLYIINTVL